MNTGAAAGEDGPSLETKSSSNRETTCSTSHPLSPNWLFVCPTEPVPRRDTAISSSTMGFSSIVVPGEKGLSRRHGRGVHELTNIPSSPEQKLVAIGTADLDWVFPVNISLEPVPTQSAEHEALARHSFNVEPAQHSFTRLEVHLEGASPAESSSFNHCARY